MRATLSAVAAALFAIASPLLGSAQPAPGSARYTAATVVKSGMVDAPIMDGSSVLVIGAPEAGVFVLHQGKAIYATQGWGNVSGAADFKKFTGRFIEAEATGGRLVRGLEMEWCADIKIDDPKAELGFRARRDCSLFYLWCSAGKCRTASADGSPMDE
jgi:hypothetical protein